MANSEVFDVYFRRADLDHDGRISGQEAVAFFQGANLPKVILAKIWQYADQGQTGFLSKAEFYNALKLVTVAQAGRELTPDIVRSALAGPASSQIPPPRITPPAGFSPMTQQPQGYRISVSGTGGGTNAQPYLHGLATNNQLAAMPPNSSAPGPINPVGPRFPIPGMAVSAANHLSTEWPNKPLIAGQSAPAPIANVVVPASQTKENSLPSSQASPDAFAGTVTQAGSESSLIDGPKKPPVISSTGPPVDSLFGEDVFTATPVTSASISSKSQPPITVQTSQGLGNRVMQPDLSSRAIVPTSVPPASTTKQLQPVPRQARPADMRDQAFGISPSNMVAGGQWTKLTHSDIQRYMNVFTKVDIDRDGKITGDQARELFLSWHLPREILKQIWDLSDQDHDSMLSLREFCIALYLMERFREGQMLPPHLPSGVLFDESAVAALHSAEARARGALHSAGMNVSVQQQDPGFLQHSGQAVLTRSIQPVPNSSAPGQMPRQARIPVGDGIDATRLAQTKSAVPVLEMNLVSQLNTDDQQTLKAKHMEAEEAHKKLQELEKDMMDSKAKMEFYRTKLQEIILFKTRCDNQLAEVTERAATDKHEVESLVRRYDEKFKHTGETNSRLLADEAAFRGLQEKRLELYNVLVRMEQGGNTNELLQSCANRMQSDLDELRKVLNEKCKHLGLHIKPSAVIELPYGWQPGSQENAAEWDDDWDKFDDEGFVIVQDLLDDSTEAGFAIKPNTTASWDDSGLYDDNFDLTSHENTLSKEEGEDLPSDGKHLGVRSPRAGSEGGSVGSGIESPRLESVASSPGLGLHGTHGNQTISKESQRYNGAFMHDQDAFDDLPLNSSRNDQEPTSLNSGSDLHTDNGDMWASLFSTKNDDGDEDVPTSWGLHSDSSSAEVLPGVGPKTAKNSQSVTSYAFGHSFDILSGPVQEHDQEYRSFEPIRTMEKSSIFDNSVPSTPLFSVNSPARPSSVGSFDEHLARHEQFMRFDSFSSNHDTIYNMGHETFSRFDSFSSVQDAVHSREFASFDDSDPFGGTGPFAAGQSSRNSTDIWSSFS